MCRILKECTLRHSAISICIRVLAHLSAIRGFDFSMHISCNGYKDLTISDDALAYRDLVIAELLNYGRLVNSANMTMHSLFKICAIQLVQGANNDIASQVTSC